ncbi:putative alpha-E superfamily protein [Rhizomicrobium palustre]|uniref:Putative alpha-E superfamily protein n=1 Tax=Rhizomicrobium palustre TaxID=189966 RepID=A0A846MXV6_9PROT|nr:alpha-E domain-containing protein [Rhizomicrobium palustre]NIK88079.1 putative alpha-E superfamily protein [Rhizomicrobium palustre]
MLSRVADSLYWMSRYLERAEHTARLLAVKLETTVEQTGEEAEASWQRVVACLSAEEEAPRDSDAMVITQHLAFDRESPNSLLASLAFARENARQVREQLTVEVWENLNRLYLKLRGNDMLDTRYPATIFRETLQDLHALGGVTYSTLSHGEGWYFLELGRHLERAQLVCRLLDLHFGAAKMMVAAEPKYFDWLVLLKFCSAFEPYCKVYTAAIQPEKIADFLLFDPEFPHSVRFSIDRVCDALLRVAPGAPPNRRASVERLAGRLKALADFTQVEELMAQGTIAKFLADIAAQCEEIHDAVYAAYITYGAETVL